MVGPEPSRDINALLLAFSMLATPILMSLTYSLMALMWAASIMIVAKTETAYQSAVKTIRPKISSVSTQSTKPLDVKMQMLVSATPGMVADFISNNELRKTWSAGDEAKTSIAWDAASKAWLIVEENLEVKSMKSRLFEIKSTQKIDRLVLTCMA